MVGIIHGSYSPAVQERGGPLYRSEVDLHRVLDLAGVATGHRYGDRDAVVAAELEHEAVALGEALLERSTILSDHGKPMRRISLCESVPSTTRRR